MRNKGIMKKLRFVICIVISILLGAGAVPYLPVQAFVDESYVPPAGTSLVYVSDMTIAPGVKEQQVAMLDSSYRNVQNFVVEVDLKDNPSASIVAGNWHDTTNFNLAYLSRQVYYAQQNGKNVVAAFNGDFFNTGTGEPLGCFIKDGEVVKRLGDGRYFFGIKKDNSAVIGDKSLYDSVENELTQAIGAGDVLVADGQAVDFSSKDPFYADKHPRTAVGLKEDGTVVFNLADGRQGYYSIGYTMSELAAFMKSMGCVTAVNLDGGSSSTYMAKKAGTNQVMLRNRPSNGYERQVGTSLLVLSSSTSDGSFDSAVIEPGDKIYTPDSTIKFTATGLDSANEPADLPSDVLWQLSDDSFGVISSTGEFLSNGKEGDLEVRLLYQDQVVGRATVGIHRPDTLDFVTKEISLGFNVVNDLGLKATYKNRDVILKDEDLEWTVPESLGVMEGNMLHTSPSNSASGTITAAVPKTGISASLNVQVGQLPVVLYDFEDGVGDWVSSVVGKGEVASIESVSYDSGEPVRFGSKSLKLNFDLTNAQTQTTLGAYAGPELSKEIPGMPTGIGAWVYASEEAQGYWLRFCYYDASGTQQFGNFTEEGVGINWTGWKYCEVDLTQKQGPFMTREKQMIRMMSVKSGVEGPMTKGEVYVDDVRVVYGVSSDDMRPPVVKSISADGQVFTDSSVSMQATFEDDYSDEYASGMDYEKVNVYVDGINYKDVKGIYSLDPSANTVYITDLILPDGPHRVDVVIRDMFGNETTQSAYFTVQTGTGTTVSLKPADGAKPMLGGLYQLKLSSNNAAAVSSLKALLTTGKNFPVENVEFNSNYTGTYTYNAKKGSLNIQMNLKEQSLASQDEELAVITVRIPNTLKEGDKFTYKLETGEVHYVNSQQVGSFMIEPQSVKVEAAYRLSVVENMVGKNLALKVTDSDGSPAKGIEIKMTPGSSPETTFGITDSNGIAESSQPVSNAYDFTAYAVKDEMLSFLLKGQTLSPLGTNLPFNIRANGVENAASSKNITWMSNPFTSKNRTVLQFCLSSEYESNGASAFKEVAGDYRSSSFTGDLNVENNGIIRVNSAIATGLDPGSKYSYRVGDGENWSQVRNFTQPMDNAPVNFFILGDTQTENTLNLKEILNVLSKSETKYQFGIHTGDMVDDANRYSQWNAVSQAFASSGIADLDLIQILGNHEYMGDTSGSTAKAYFNTPLNGPDANKGGAYSVEYGNVYFAVLGYSTDRATLEKELEWLRSDAAKTTRRWKVVLTHQPPYYSNPDGNQDLYKALLPPIMDELGIDFVFSGHDHAYARTYPLYNGEIDTNGTTYFVCGSTGEKYYTAVKDEHFEIFDDTKDSCYLSVSATSEQFKIEARRSTGEIMDSFTKEKNVPAKISLTASGYTAEFQDTIQLAAQVTDNKGADITSQCSVRYEVIQGPGSVNANGVLAFTGSGQVKVLAAALFQGIEIASDPITVLVKEQPPAPALNKVSLKASKTVAGLKDKVKLTTQAWDQYQTDITKSCRITYKITGSAVVNSNGVLSFSKAGKVSVYAVISCQGVTKNTAPVSITVNPDPKIQLKTPAVKSVTSILASSGPRVKVTVSRTVKGADTYTVYRKAGSKIVTLGKTDKKGIIYDSKPLTNGQKTGYYAIAYSKDAKYSTSRKSTLKYITLPKAPSRLKVSKVKKTVKLTWSKASKVKEYMIFRSEKASSGYRKIASVKNNTYYTDKKVKKGKTYYYGIVVKSTSKKYSGMKTVGKLRF